MPRIQKEENKKHGDKMEPLIEETQKKTSGQRNQSAEEEDATELQDDDDEDLQNDDPEDSRDLDTEH